MAELKVASLFEFEKVLQGRSNKLFYGKSEADKVIAEKDKEIAELKKQVHDYAQGLYVIQASMYCDVVDANMYNRKLKRALWLARKKRAEARKNYWYVRSIHEGDDRLWSIDGSPVKYIGCIKRTNFDWLKIWCEVECKCRAKADEFKEE